MRSLTAAGALLMLAAPLVAQSDPLGHLVREGLERSLTLRQHRMALREREAALREASGGFLPSLSLSARYSETEGGIDLGELVNPAYRALNQLSGSDRFPTDVDASLPLAQETKVTLVQPLFQPALSASRGIQRSLRDLEGAELRVAARRLAADVQQGYLALASAERVAELYRETLPLLDENLRVAERLLERGRVTPDALFRARAERSEAEQALLEAEQRARAARRALNLLLDREPDAPVEMVTDSLLDFPLRLSLDEALRSALSRREELRGVEAGVEAARAEQRLARAGRLPGVSLALDYGIQGRDYRLGPDHDFAVASLVLQWSAWDGGRTGARASQARARADRLRVQRDEVERRIGLEVRQAYEEAETARAAIGAARERLAAARRTWELVRRRWEEGMAPSVELVDARTAFTTAGLNEILTRYRYAARWVELERAAALRELEP